MSELALTDAVDEIQLASGTPAGEYVIECLLGSGGFARVYQAMHPTLATRVAIKVLDRSLSADSESMQRFTREAQAANRIDHPSVVRVLGFGKLGDGRSYQVLELVEGPSLDEYLLSHGRLTIETTMTLLEAIAQALGAAHDIGIVHRDLKPSNVLIAQQDGRLLPRLTDFGIAKAIDTQEDSKLTRTGSTLGTPTYMSPEQALGSKIGAQSDVYSFGVVAFELLTGKVPFEGESPFAVMMQHVQAVPPQPSKMLPLLGVAFDQPLARMLSKKPDQRPATIEDAMNALRQAARAAGRPQPRVAAGSHHHGASLEVSRTTLKSKRTVAALAALALVGAGVAWRATRDGTSDVIPTNQVAPSSLSGPAVPLDPTPTITPLGNGKLQNTAAAPEVPTALPPSTNASTRNKNRDRTDTKKPPMTVRTNKGLAAGQAGRDSESIEVPPDYQTP